MDILFLKLSILISLAISNIRKLKCHFDSFRNQYIRNLYSMVSCQHLMIERDDRMLGTLLLYQLLKINVSQTDSKQIKFYILQGRCVDVALLAKFFT